MTPLIADYESLLDKLTLSVGKHAYRETGVCAMEAAAWIAGQPHSDYPPCVSPVIGAFLRNWNDNLPDNTTRDRLLKPLLPLIIGTASDLKTEEQRSYMALDWLIREHIPAWFDLTLSLKPHSDGLRAGDVINCFEAVKAAQHKLVAVRAATRDATRDAAGDAWDAINSALKAAAWDAAWDAWHSISAITWDATSGATWGGTWHVAWDATLDATWSVTRAATRAALKPTTVQLQHSACGLVRRMCQI